MALARLKNLVSVLSPAHNFVLRSRYPVQCSSRIIKRNMTKRTIKSTKILVNGVNINFEEVGDGDHVILLVPGALGCSQIDFFPQLNGLDTGKYTLISFDPRGYGKSRPPERDWPLLYLQRDAEDAATLMKILGKEKYSILGWSDGGTVGMILAAAYPGCVQKLVLWGSNAYITEGDMKLYRGFDNIDEWSESMKKPLIDLYGEEYLRKHWKCWVDAFDRYFKERKGDICIEDLPKIKCPTLFVNGLKDALLFQEHPKFIQEHIKNCRTIVWPEGKHNLHLRYPKEFNEMVEHFFDE